MTGIDDEVNSSVLGKKEYWDCSYEAELINFSNYGDEGEIWFGEKVQTQMVQYLQEKILNGQNVSTELVIMDIGCGNGMLLVELAAACKVGVKLQLKGFDYSPNAVELAQKVVTKHAFSHMVQLFVADFLSNDFDERCDIAVDKGTFDAISLMPVEDKDMLENNNLKKYRASLIRSLRHQSKMVTEKDSDGDSCQSSTLAAATEVKELPFNFMITSCNYTEKELCEFFNPPDFNFVHSISRKPFSFGGSSGQTFTTVLFKCVPSPSLAITR